MAIAIVDMANAELAAGPRPTVNMWWLHTNQPMNAITMPAKTTNGYPNNGLREKTGRMSDTIPMAGRISMYTSGWPNSQNMCCHRTGSPPLMGL